MCTGNDFEATKQMSKRSSGILSKWSLTALGAPPTRPGASQQSPNDVNKLHENNVNVQTP